jgi:outer membrane immunogenic protein
MRKIVLALTSAVASLIVSNAALAADLPARPYTAPAVVLPNWNWTGFYAGLNAGYGWGDQTLIVTGAGSGSIKTSPSGFAGGGQIGYNWQAPNRFVFGVEADIQGANLKNTTNGTLTVLGVPVAVNTTGKVDYFGTVRGRLGYAVGSWMPYFTGGWAYGGASSSGTIGGIAFSGSNSRTDGWTLGGGVEWMFGANWIAGVEYLYISFPGSSITAAGVTASTNDFTANVVRGRVSYKF